MRHFDVFTGYPVSKAKKLANRALVAYLQRFAKQPQFDTGSTFFRSMGPAISTQEALKGMNSQEMNDYIAYTQSAKHPQMTIKGQHRAIGYWVPPDTKEGSPEPSLYSHLSSPHEDHVKRWASDIGQKYNQDAVVLFEHKKDGDDKRFTITIPPSVELGQPLFDYLHDHGLQYFTYFPKTHKMIILAEAEDQPKVENLIKTFQKQHIAGKHHTAPGSMEFIDRTSYAHHLQPHP